jgi:hypothetical protein
MLSLLTRYVSLLSSFRSMLKETPLPAAKTTPLAAAVTPSKTHQCGRSITRIKQQQQHNKERSRGGGVDESLVDTGTPSKVALGHDFRSHFVVAALCVQQPAISCICSFL